MSDDDRQSTRPAREPTADSTLSLAVGTLLVAVLVGAYILIGTPGLHTQVAYVPASATDVTVSVPRLSPASSPSPPLSAH